MSRTRIDAAALLLGIVVAAPGLLVSSSPNLSYLTGAFGLTAVLVLLAFDREGYRSVFESIAYAAVIGLCLISPVSLLLQLAGMTFDSVRHLVVWVVALVVFVAVDRARMSGRVEPAATESFIRPPAAAYAPPQPAFAQPMYAPQPTPAAPPPIYGANYPYAAATGATPAPFAAAPVTVPQPPAPAPPVPAMAAAPPPVYNPPPAPPVFAMPPAATPAPQQVSTVSEPPAVTPEVLAPPTAAQPAPAPVPNFTAPLPPVPVQQPTNVLPVPAGKEALIYVNLKDEGLNVLRSVHAEHLGRDYYRIVEEMPAGETWEFQQGQIVRCVKKKLSSGKALVATEEAPRAR